MISTFSQVFSCISRALNTKNAFSLPKMQRICDDAYRTKSVLSHHVLSNNFAWSDWIHPHVIPKGQFTAGILAVSFVVFALLYAKHICWISEHNDYVEQVIL